MVAEIVPVSRNDVLSFVSDVYGAFRAHKKERSVFKKSAIKKAKRILTDPEEQEGVIANVLKDISENKDRFLALAAYRSLLEARIMPVSILHKKINFDETGPILRIKPCPN